MKYIVLKNAESVFPSFFVCAADFVSFLIWRAQRFNVLTPCRAYPPLLTPLL